MTDNIFILPAMSKEALNNLPFGAYIINKEGQVEFFNSEMVKISGVKEAGEIEGQNIREIPTYKEYGLLEYIEKGLSGESFRIEGIKYISFIGKKESFRSYYGIPVKNKDGETQKLLCIVEDITENRNNQERIKADLVEKEVLLKEIQHRVKNNMQVIYSLLNMQSRNIKDGSARKLIEESKGQIKSILLVHESLYQSPDIGRIDFGEYIKNLIINLFNLFLVDRNLVSYKIDVIKAELNISGAIPCALIINELVTNSLKYAFPDKRTGEINIGLKSADELNYELTVSDNGVGFDMTSVNSANSLGMTLVNTLSQQIYGSIRVVSEKDKGTKCVIKFPKTI
ncbi:MAG: histidine kinase dimerization/phosphoacceptor domain -containing protein [Candidatus Falkowbacteria bacterium]